MVRINNPDFFSIKHYHQIILFCNLLILFFNIDNDPYPIFPILLTNLSKDSSKIRYYTIYRTRMSNNKNILIQFCCFITKDFNLSKKTLFDSPFGISKLIISFSQDFICSFGISSNLFISQSPK